MAILAGNVASNFIPNPVVETAVKGISKGAGIVKEEYDRLVKPVLETYKEHTAAKSDAEILESSQAATDYAIAQSGKAALPPKKNLYETPPNISKP